MGNQKKTIDEYCMEKEEFVRKEHESYACARKTEIRVYRYEDVIFDKTNWLGDMISYLGVGVSAEVIASIAKKHDIRPTEENPMRHIRQVTPGNFRRHLQPSTIETLNSSFADIITENGYAF